MRALCLAALLLTACFDRGLIRPDHSELSADARPIMFEAFGKAPAVHQDADATFKFHYDKAVELYKANKFEDSISEFEAAYAIKDEPLVLYNMAQAYRKAGRDDEAIASYDRFLRVDPKNSEHAHAEQYLKELKAKKKKHAPAKGALTPVP